MGYYSSATSVCHRPCNLCDPSCMFIEQGAEVNFQPVIVKQCSWWGLNTRGQLHSNRPDEPIDFLLYWRKRIKVTRLTSSLTGNESRSHLNSRSCASPWPDTCCSHYDIVFSTERESSRREVRATSQSPTLALVLALTGTWWKKTTYAAQVWTLKMGWWCC